MSLISLSAILAIAISNSPNIQPDPRIFANCMNDHRYAVFVKSEAMKGISKGHVIRVMINRLRHQRKRDVIRPSSLNRITELAYSSPNVTVYEFSKSVFVDCMQNDTNNQK